MKWLAVYLLLGVASPALGSEAVFADIAPAQIREALDRAGLPADLQTSPDGPQIWSRLDERSFNVFFFSCSAAREPRCKEAQFYAGFPLDGVFPTAAINSWNGAHRFGRAYIDHDGNAALEMDLDLVGTSRSQINDAVQWWKTLVPQFAAFLSQSMKPQLSPSAEATPRPSPSAY
jgi:hypothetical protein